jgi:hypothetical protein
LTEVAAIRSMVQALRWAESRSPRAEFVNAVTQDEFTSDVIVRVGDDVYVVFDTT